MISDFKLNSEIKGNMLIISTEGYINNNGGQKIADEFYSKKTNDIKKVILNLEKTKVVNSIGISFLIELIEKLNESNGKLVFTNLDASIDKTFTIMGLYHFAEKTDTVEQALGAG
ncbi:MAG: anti-anti-sigma factor [Ignavibacteriae bacterium HGW-Ignavibacteriae-2]|jgi:anti-anti-sigma factor|nr:MAG: anti-anti-sigma factor [Ignavibacteriae bacterium HGW-Ignavibacteriae-2]